MGFNLTSIFRIRPEKYFLDRYQVDEVHFHEGSVISDYLKKLGTKNLLLLKADNTDSGKILDPAQFPGRDQFKADNDTLYPVIAELRVFKTDKELEVLRYASKIASEAHKEVMRSIKPGLYEYQAESVFKHLSYFSGTCL